MLPLLLDRGRTNARPASSISQSCFEHLSWFAEDAAVRLNAKAGACRQANMAIRDCDRIDSIIVSFNVWRGNPGASQKPGLDRGGDVNARGGDDVAAPGVVAGMRQRSQCADVPGRRHRGK